MSFPPTGVPLSDVALTATTSDLLDLDFRNADVDADAGTITTPSGHVFTWSRATTLGSVADLNGTTYTALDGQMAWEMRDWDGDASRESFGLRMGTSDRLAAPSNVRAIAMAGLLEFIETGAVSSANSVIFSLRNDGATGAGLWIDTSGTNYRINYRDGSTTRTATLAAAPSTGNRVILCWELTSAGVVSIQQSINAAAFTTASASALALPSAWASSVSWRLNAGGTGGSANAGQGWYRRARVVAGTINTTTIQERR